MKKILRKKEITNEDIVGTIDNLAIMVAKGFDRVEDRIGKVEDRIGNIEKEVGEVKENLASTRRDILEDGDRFVQKYEFHNLLLRFDRLEQKVKEK